MKKVFSNRSLLLVASKSRKLNKGVVSGLKKMLPVILIFILVSINGFSLNVFLKNGNANNNTLNLTKKWEQHPDQNFTTTDTVPWQTTQAFKQDYPKATDVSWSSEKGFDEASFTLDGKNEIAFYGYDNVLVGTETIMSKENLPQKGLEKIQKDYPDYSLEKVVYYNDNESNDNPYSLEGYDIDVDAYYVVLRKKDGSKVVIVQVDPNGEILYIDRVSKK